MYEYNTVLDKLTLREYGRNIQMLVQHLKTLEDSENKNIKAETLVELMRQINPSIKDTPEIAQKIWDDLHIISNFELNVEGPFPKPDKNIIHKKPEKVPYQTNEIVFKHFGRNIELLVNKAITLEDPEEKEAAIIHIGKLMKTFFSSYNKDVMEDDVVYANIRQLSKNELDIDMAKVKEGNLFEPVRKERRNDRGDRNRGRGGRKGGGKRRKN